MARQLTRAELRRRILDEIPPVGASEISDFVRATSGAPSRVVREILAALEEDGAVVKLVGTSLHGRSIEQWRHPYRRSMTAANQPAMRTCLMCRQDFMSAHAGNRRCPSCESAVQRQSGAGTFDTPVVLSHR